ncbi:MAG: SGNH/GDSL hydrolase family protein [Candidatus Diapherotrites archaeon]|nr:SGNH/GDSL hydrolase family protein [Candidatus Diapherotrites archaeon]
MTHILVFGDSTTYGAWDKKGGWVSRIREKLDQKNIPNNKYLLIYNLGISGGTTTGLVKRFESEAKIRLDDDPTEQNIFIFSGGGNDAIWLPKKKQNKVALPIFKRNIRRLIKMTRRYSDKMVFLGIKPCDESKVDPIPWYPKGSYRLKQFEKYNEALKKICMEEKVYFVNAFAILNNKTFISTLNDGIHPNNKGHQLIEKIVWAALNKKKWI